MQSFHCLLSTVLISASNKRHRLCAKFRAQGALQSQSMSLELKAKDIQEKSTAARRARDAAVQGKERDIHAAQLAQQECETIATDEASRRLSHSEEMARLQAILSELQSDQDCQLRGMREKHLQTIAEIEAELQMELSRLKAKSGNGGLDLDEIMQEARTILESNNSPYAESKVN